VQKHVLPTFIQHGRQKKLLDYTKYLKKSTISDWIFSDSNLKIT